MSESEAYKKAGVDLSAADEAGKRIAKLAKETFTPGVESEIGSFGGVYRFPSNSDNLLLASCDGVGTKLKVAAAAGIYDTVGRSLVNHCVNDILTLGATPLFFLDYVGHLDLEPGQIADVVEGLSIACRRNGLALIGGETAQMPGVYSSGEFDLVGFILGSVSEDKLIDGSDIEPGNKIIAIGSNGLQTNGYSLARKVLLDSGRFELSERPEGLQDSVSEALLAIHPSYLEPVLALLSANVQIRGMAHITGGGIPGNLSRILPEGCLASVDVADVPVPPVFELIQNEGDIPAGEMYEVFNMGAGFMLIVDETAFEEAISIINADDYKAIPCGEIIPGKRGVELGGLD